MKQTFWYRGQWMDEQPLVTGPLDVGFWSGSSVFDGARAIAGCTPDLDLHAERCVRSAKAMLMHPTIDGSEIARLCRQAVARLPADRDYYIRPMFFANKGGVIPEPGGTEFVLAIFELAMPPEVAGSACLSSFRRNAPDQGPTDAKAGCLYPNGQRALAEAQARGFDLALMRDPAGNVAEFSTANIWIVKDGVAMTPAANGTFLSGITRRRLIQLLRTDGIPVEERTLTPRDVERADEIIVCGNYGKIQTVVRYEDRLLDPGPVFRRARQLYMDFVETERVAKAAA